MYIVFVVLLWILAAIFIIADPKSETNRWASATLFFSGFGGVDDLILKDISLLLEHYYRINGGVIYFLQWVAAAFSSFSILLFPYCYFLFCINYTGMLKPKDLRWRTGVALLLAIPVVLMFRYIPFFNFIHLDLDQTGTQIVTLWAAPYVLIANILLIHTYFRTHHPKMKQERLLTCIIATPSSLAGLLFGYVIVALGVLDAWKYQIWITLFLFAVFFICTVTYGAVGVKLRFEKNRLDSTMKAISSGTLILNHTIKNEINKMAMCTDNMKAAESKFDPKLFGSLIKENLEVIENSIDHLSALVTRMRGQMQEIALSESPQNLSIIITEALNLVTPFIQAKNIRVKKAESCDLDIRCDRVHLREVLVNIFKNAIEAMGTDGLLQIETYQNKKNLIVVIKDNGIGIAKENLAKVYDPFFSTKNRQRNFGLGLSYCYNVMQQHGGFIEIYSEENNGTTVFLNFPRHKVLRTVNQLAEVEVFYG